MHRSASNLHRWRIKSICIYPKSAHISDNYCTYLARDSIWNQQAPNLHSCFRQNASLWLYALRTPSPNTCFTTGKKTSFKSTRLFFYTFYNYTCLMSCIFNPWYSLLFVEDPFISYLILLGNLTKSHIWFLCSDWIFSIVAPPYPKNEREPKDLNEHNQLCL